MGGTVLLLDNPVMAISSTQLRRLLVFRCAGQFIPEKVREFIYENGLYGTGRDYRNLPMEELEPVAIALHDPKRVPHVLGCRDTAARLAKIWGVDPDTAARAGLLHDITKACQLFGRVGECLLDDWLIVLIHSYLCRCRACVDYQYPKTTRGRAMICYCLAILHLIVCRDVEFNSHLRRFFIVISLSLAVSVAVCGLASSQTSQCN